jgi:hypothetical protein
MKKETIREMRETGRIRLKGQDILFYYTPAWLLLLIPGFCIPDYYKIYIAHTYTGIRSAGDLFWPTIPFAILALVVYYFQKRDLEFQEINISQSFDQFKEALARTAAQQDLNISHCDHDYAIAVRNKYRWSAGTIITIIRNDHQLLINSRSDPEPYIRPVTFGSVKKYKRIFLQNLEVVKLGLPAPIVDPDGLPAKEWTFKRIIARLFLYPLSTFFIGFSVLFLIPQGHILMALILSAVACIYLYTDLKIIFFMRKIRR